MVMAGMDRATYCRASAAGADAWMAGKRRCLAARSHQIPWKIWATWGIIPVSIYIRGMGKWLYNDNGDIMVI